jgi:hypothetical protein
MRNRRNIFVAVTGFCLGLAALSWSGELQAKPEAEGNSVSYIVLPQYPPEIPAGPNVETYRQYCLTCHSARYVLMQPNFSRSVWEKEVKKMVDAYGATVPEAEQMKVIDYLVAVNGPAAGDRAPAPPAPKK